MLRRYTCKTVRNMLPLHVGRDLDPIHTPHVDEHLRTCLPCFREFRALTEVRGCLGVLAEEPLPAGILDGFTEEVMARIEIAEPGPVAELPRAPLRPILAWPRLAAAAALLLVAISAWKLVDEGGGLRPARDDVPVPGVRVDQPEGFGGDGPVYLISPAGRLLQLTPEQVRLHQLGGMDALQQLLESSGRLPDESSPAAPGPARTQDPVLDR